jgi:hypothetical protein
MPEVPDYAIPLGVFWRYVWDTTGIPVEQPGPPLFGRETVILTPQLGRLTIYGQQCDSPYPEDSRGLRVALENGRIMGQWFSAACPDGELGMVALDVCTEISEVEFSAAFQRGWRMPKAETDDDSA